MLKQVCKLWAVSARDIFGLNRMIHNRDKKDKAMQMATFFILLLSLGIVFEGYMLINIISYINMGLGDIVPMYCFLMASILVLVVTYFKAGNVVFHLKTYEMLMALPVKKSAIVISRFFHLYTTGLILTVLISFPGMIMYGVMTGRNVLYYLVFIVGMILAPFLPITIATAICAIVKLISIKLKYKSIVEAVLMIGIALAVVLLSSNFRDVEINEQLFLHMYDFFVSMVNSVYPPAAWFNEAVLSLNLWKLMLLVVVYLSLFCILILGLRLCYTEVCIALNASNAKHDYRRVVAGQSSLRKALIMKEFRCYLSHSIYMTNTLMGSVLMVAASIVVCCFGGKLIHDTPITEEQIKTLLPFLMAVCGIMMPTTAASISIEGKNRWISRTLPVSDKLQWDSKILMFLLVSAPFYVVSVLVAAIGFHMQGLHLIWIVLIPAAYLVFGGVWGITMNIRFPKFDWDDEVKVVKQGAAAFASMIGGIAAVLIPVGLTFVFPAHAVCLATVVLLLLFSAFLYKKNQRSGK